ncbi:hypothetical protein MMAD_34310 [Mycolicibacterium madagascariense]|uniref:Uncharacterized protein n=1 Tax=Mycolicibacterium madagascariense TaxID=212765 RepID=A0A7I7XIU3_9MYCO|nr:hypothetical protein MMAD_34310 [Mycolicibacterium madagascariense]
MAKRREAVRASDDRVRTPRTPRPAGTPREAAGRRRAVEAPPRPRRSAREQRPPRPEDSRPHTGPMPRPTEAPKRPKNAAQAKARAKARKAKAPKLVRPPLRDRLLTRLAAIELDPRRFVTRVPFVVLVIGALGVGLGVTLWLSTDAAERSYELGRTRQVNQALLQQKEGLERDVLEAQAAPALAEAARNLGMIPSRDTAHLVQDPTGNWLVVGTPKPAQGVPPPPLNSPIPDPGPPVPPPPPAPRVVDPREVTVHLPPAPAAVPNPEVALPATVVPPGGAPVPGAPAMAGPAPAPAPAPDAAAPPAAVAAPVPAPVAPPAAVPPAPGPPAAVAAPPAAPMDGVSVLPGPPPAAQVAPAPAPGAPA